MTIALLRVVLLARFAVCLVFAAQLHEGAPATLAALAQSFEWFAFVNGILALALFPLVLAVSWGAAVVAVVLIDGIVSIALGAALHWWPGIPGFSVSAVLFSGVVSVLSVLIGLFQLAAAVQLRRRTGSAAIGLGVGVLGATVIVISALSFLSDVTPSASRNRLIAESALQAIAFAAIAISARRRKEWTAVHA